MSAHSTQVSQWRRWNPFRWFATGRALPPISDPATIDRVYRQSRLSVLSAITLGYGFMYTCRLGLSVVKKPLIDHNIFTADDLGQIGSTLFWGYAIGKLVNGFLADHANIRKFFAVGVLCSAVINLVMGGSPILWLWMVLWGINGWFQGFGSPASGVSLSNWFRTRERGTYYGIWSMSHSIGEGLTFVVSALLVSHFGWRGGFIGPGLFCVAMAALLYLFLRDRPETLGLPPVGQWRPHGSIESAETVPSAESLLVHGASLSGWDRLREQAAIFRRPSLWILGLSSATMYITRYAINSWGIIYLQEAKGYSLTDAGAILGVNAVAGMAGAVSYGVISDRLFKSRRPPVTVLFGLAEVLALCVVFFSPPGHPYLLTGAFVLFGFTLSGLLAVLGGLFAIDIVGKKATGAAMGVIGCFSYLGAGLQDLVSGKLIGQGTTLVNGVRHYDFTWPVAFWIGSSILSVLLAAMLWNVRARE